jgi:hypothetical protein
MVSGSVHSRQRESAALTNNIVESISLFKSQTLNQNGS